MAKRLTYEAVVRKCKRCSAEVQGSNVGPHPLCGACKPIARKEAQAKHLAKRKAQGFNANLWWQHGMTQEDYDAMLAMQGGRCIGCGRLPSAKSLHVDHDHQCCPQGKSCVNCRRGLLCYNCNTMLGLAHDHPHTLRALASYVERYR